MKTTKSIRFIATLMAMAAFMLVIKSCKKVDNDGTINTKEAEAAKAAAIKAVKAQYGDISAGIVYNVNKVADELFYKNAEGEMVSLYATAATHSNGGADISGTKPCGYNCSNTINPADLNLVYTLKYVQRLYMCESNTKSSLKANWVISVPFTPLASFNGVNSVGNVKITSPTGVVLTLTNPPLNLIKIVKLGADPACSANSLYEINYTVSPIDNSYFGTGMLIDCSLNLYNDCTLVGNLVTTGFVRSPDFSLSAQTPCGRVDKVYINTGSPASAAGNYIICSYPSGFTPIDQHQLEYRKVVSPTGSLQWDNQIDIFGVSSPVRWGRPVGTAADNPVISPTGGVSYLTLMTPGSGTWLVRYRNVKVNVCNVISPASPGGYWGNPYNWVIEVWPL
jgi:hypothetical protein